MDYGHQNNQPTESPTTSASEPSFFTPGVGSADPTVNLSGPSLNSVTIGDATEQARDISASGLPANQLNTEQTLAPEDSPLRAQHGGYVGEGNGDGSHPELSSVGRPALGVITPTDPSPTYTITADYSATTDRIRPQGDHISDTAVRAMDDIASNFKDSAHSVSDAYDEVIAARAAYLKELGFAGEN